MEAAPTPPPNSRLLQTVLYLADPYRYYKRVFARWGDTFLFPSFNGDVVLSRDPQAAKIIFTLDPADFTVHAVDRLRSIVGSHSVLALEGDRHKRERKLLNPPFHGARMRSYGTQMQEAALQEISRWQPGPVLDLHRAMQRISLTIITRAVFGIVDPAQVERTQAVATEYMDSMSPLVLMFPFLAHDWLGLSPWARMQRARQEFDSLLYEQIAARRKQPVGEDILSLLLSTRYEDGSGMTDEQIHSELLTLLIAGHETTALSLSWLFYHLYRHPETLVRLRRELDALGPHPEPEQIAQTPYLDACCQETLRLYPIVGEVFRQLRRPLELGRFLVPAGTSVSVSVIGLHTNPALYPEPETFRPERFLERKYSPFEFVPFGGGIRRCLGAAFAMYEMKQVAYAVLQSCELELATARVIKPVMRGPTMGPKGGVQMRLCRRREPTAAPS